MARDTNFLHSITPVWISLSNLFDTFGCVQIFHAFGYILDLADGPPTVYKLFELLPPLHESTLAALHGMCTTAATAAWNSGIFLKMASAAKPALTKLFVARLPWITCGGKKSLFRNYSIATFVIGALGELYN